MNVTPEQHQEICALYLDYSDVLKPLLACVEAQEQKIPAALLNELRAFVDHVSRCYWTDANAADIKLNIDRAKGHIKRAKLDCFKHSALWFHKQIEAFAFQTRKVDLTTIDNGSFHVKYCDLRKKGRRQFRHAKKLETKESDDVVFPEYMKTLELFEELDVFIDENVSSIDWAKRRFTFNRALQAFGFVIAAILAGIISYIADQALGIGAAVMKLLGQTTP